MILLLTGPARCLAGDNLNASRIRSVEVQLPADHQIDFGYPLLTQPVSASVCEQPGMEAPPLARATILPLTRRIGELNGEAVYEIPGTPVLAGCSRSGQQVVEI